MRTLPGNADVVRIRRVVTGEDRNHDPIYSTTRLTIDGGVAAPRSSIDLRTGGRDGVVTGLSLCLPPGTDVVASDSFEVDGVAYEIEGAVGRWLSPFTGTDAGFEMALRRADG